MNHMQKALQSIAERGGELIAEDEFDTRYVHVRCSSGHEWRAYTAGIAGGHWCPHCYGNAPLTIESMRQIAECRGGQCLSEVYINSKTDLQWQCAYDHVWTATPYNVKNRLSWCPHCRFNVGEELVRSTLEEAFPGQLFGRTRREPWMEGLELDGFNLELRLAFEYQGKQHYERVEHFQRGVDDFEAQIERDRETVSRCEDAFMTLLVVPYTIGFAAIRGHVRRELLSLAYDIAPEDGSDVDFYDRVRAIGPSTAKQFERAQTIIARKGGECLSTKYLGYRIPLKIKCSMGHVFEASLEAIDQPASRGPRFCPECGGTRKKEDEELIAAVESCGYAYLGVESRNDGKRSRRFLTVRCPEGHEYVVSWDNFNPTGGVPRRGCAKCSSAVKGGAKRGNIDKWIEKHGIRPVSEYTTIVSPCTWQCPRGHEFVTTMASLRQKAHMCTECWLEEFARENSLELLTPWVPDSAPTTSLEWLCRRCDGTFSASVIGLGRKKRYCPSC